MNRAAMAARVLAVWVAAAGGAAWAQPGHSKGEGSGRGPRLVENVDAPFHAKPAAALPGVVRAVAVASCVRQNRPAPVLGLIAEQKPDLFVWLGDNIYADTTDAGLFRSRYHELARQDGFAKLWAGVPMLATWDDHDFGKNDGGREFEGKPLAQKLFAEFWQLPADEPARTRADGIYHSRVIGPEGRRVQVILLDTRTNRSPLAEHGGGTRASAEYPGPYAASAETGTTLLGEAQWAWLEEQLRQPAEVRLIASSVQFVSEEHRYERWANFPAERLRLIRLINTTGAKGVIVLSGDRHRGELSELRPGAATVTPPTPEAPEPRIAPAADQPAYPLWDLTASNLNQGDRPEIPEKNAHRRGALVCPENYGWVRIEWDEPGVPITLEVRAAKDGRVIETQTVKLEGLRPKA